MEREICGPVDLCDQRGRLNPDARGWSRQPALRANLSRAYGRKKRWDYWCVIAPDVIVSFVYADIDYAGLSSVWILDRTDWAQADAGTLVPFGRGFSLPEQVCTGTVAASRNGFEPRSRSAPTPPGSGHRRRHLGSVRSMSTSPWRSRRVTSHSTS